MKRSIFLFSLLFFLFLSNLSFSNTIIVFVDNTRNLDYFVDGKKYKLKNDLKELIKEYNLDSDNRLILVDLRKYSKEKIRGKILVLGNGKKLKKRFKSKMDLRNLISENVISNVDFLLLSHTISLEKFDEFLSFSGTNYDLILASACKMASIEKLKIMSNYSSYAIASPENIHLAHFDINQIAKNLSGSKIKKGKRILDSSFDRLLNYTKSNLVLNLYDLDKNLLKKNLCTTKKINKLIIHKRIKLSLFEKRGKLSNYFKLIDCQ